MFCQDAGVIGKITGEVAVGPAAPVFKSLRQIPMVERAEWTNAGFEQRVDKPAVVIDALGIGRAQSRGLYARP